MCVLITCTYSMCVYVRIPNSMTLKFQLTLDGVWVEEEEEEEEEEGGLSRPPLHHAHPHPGSLCGRWAEPGGREGVEGRREGREGKGGKKVSRGRR